MYIFKKCHFYENHIANAIKKWYNKTIKRGGTPYKVAKLLYERSALKC